MCMIKIPFGISQIQYIYEIEMMRSVRHREDRLLKCLIWFTPAQQNIYFSTLIAVFITLGAIEKRKEMRWCLCLLLYHKYVILGFTRAAAE